MKYKIPYKTFIKTIDDKGLQDIRDFRKVMKMHQEGLTRKEILKKTGLSLDKLGQWRNRSIKPNAIKIIEKANDRGYFNYYGDEQLEKIAYLVGLNIGDGNISKNLCNTWFYGINTDLENVRNLLLEFNIRPVIYTYKINNGKMAIHDHIFSRFLVSFGAIIGDKTKNAYYIPEWIKKSKTRSLVKKRFLQGFFDSELSDMKLNKDRNFSYKNLRLHSIKEEGFIEEGKNFLNQVRGILKEFKISSSEVKLEKRYKRKRDGSTMQALFFIIPANYINLHNFINNVGFLYNSKRKKHAEENKKKIEELVKREKEKIKKYKKAINLRKKGLSAYKIAKKLNIETHHIKNWIYFKRKPRLYNFMEN